jgi:hypothetical protein
MSLQTLDVMLQVRQAVRECLPASWWKLRQRRRALAMCSREHVHALCSHSFVQYHARLTTI